MKLSVVFSYLLSVVWYIINKDCGCDRQFSIRWFFLFSPPCIRLTKNAKNDIIVIIIRNKKYGKRAKK